MNVEIPEINCSLVVENLARNGSVLGKSSLPGAHLTLGRNQTGDCVLVVTDNKTRKEHRRIVFPKNREHYRLNTKFVKDGKCSIFLIDLAIRIFISNCPPNDLSLFLKGFSLKCNYYSKQLFDHTKLQTRCLPKAQDSGEIVKISPLTVNDLARSAVLRERNIGLSSLTSSTSPITANKRTNKRKLDLVLEKISNSSPKSRKVLMTSIIPSPVRSLKVLNANSLTDEQSRVLSAVMHGQNLFFTGSAGTGKSYLLKFIIGRLPPETTVVTASTGIAACHIGGITPHFFAGIPVTWLEPTTVGNQMRLLTTKEIVARLLKNQLKVQRWRNCKCLIIDEISMVPGNYFELLDQVARIIRKNDQPFGGIQVVLCGDFLQLPPITKDDKMKYSFQTSAWNKVIKYCFELRKIQRQSDPAFIKVLQLLRIGKITSSVKETLIKTSQNNLRRENHVPTQLYTHRREVDKINTSQLGKLTSSSIYFSAEDSHELYSSLLDLMCPTPRRLELKLGAQVMLNKNIDVSRGLSNGLTGRVVSFERDTSTNRPLPRVVFINGIETVIDYQRWSVRVGGPEAHTVHRKHLPLQLSWALSVHKSQGMTINNGVEISLAKVFETGQAYVALSRATSLDNVKIIDFNPNNIIVDRNALEFYQRLKYV